MNNNIMFSFVMPAYKSQFIGKAIDSILKQTFREFELIIVNDASPENLIAEIKQFNDNRIRYEENEKNIGGHDLVANWNHCIEYARNEYIILAADDDIFEPNFLEDAVALIKKYPHVDIFRSGVKKINEQDNILDMEFPLKEYMTCREFTLYYAKGGTISCVSNYIIRKEALSKIGGFISFPKAHYSDDATALALISNGIACMANNNFSFRVSSINLSNRNDLTIAKEQLKATDLYMEWYLCHVEKLDTVPHDFFRKACYGYFKIRYIWMIDNLISKFPMTKIFFIIRYISSNKHLFKKEKCKLLFSYIINK
jgi:glycosyltransferase involved in cell wall biosynthesis